MRITLLVMSVMTLILYNRVKADTYTDKYDNVDLDSILKNDRLVNSYINCLLDKGKCTPEGDELKAHIIDALETGCAKCTDKQKAGIKKVATFMYKNKPDDLKKIVEKFDPDRKYRTKYADRLKEWGIEA